MKKYISLLGILLCILMLSGCIEFTRIIYADPLNPKDYIMTKEEAYVLQDGTAVSLWEPHENSTISSYRLKDGQELLEVDLPIPINSVHEQGLEGAKNMTSEALNAALLYYENQGLLLDIPTLLENAYSDYTLCQEEGKKFQAHLASQETSPCVETERYVGFNTTIEIPSSSRNETYEETSQVILFDSSTGDVIPPEDLFTVSKEEAVRLLEECCKKNLPTKHWESAKSMISLERAQWMQGGILMCFYAEELPDEDSDWEILISYDDLKEVLQPWAIPESKS